MIALAWALLSVQADPGTDAVRALLRRRDAEGSWSSGPGARALAVLAFLRGGWSELSEDEFDGVRLGELLGRELDRIAAAQRDDGLFHAEDPTANAWSALAFTEAFGLTGLKRREAPARRGVEAIQGMPAADEEALFWQYQVRVSADLAGLLPRGPEPLPLEDPVRENMRAFWWRGEDLPLPALDPARATPADLYVRDQATWGRRHARAEHEAWKALAAAGLAAEKEAEGAAFRAMVAFGGRCWPCRNVFGND